MAMAQVLLKQLIIMFIYMAAGWGLAKTGLITMEGSKSITNLLLYVILPCVIIRSFCTEASSQLMITVLLSIAGAAAVLGTSMAVAHAVFKKSPMDDFGAAFSNAGFMGLPLVSAVLGSDAVIYAAGMVALLNILQWTYGQAVLSGDRHMMSAKKVLSNPLVIAFAIGLVIFFLGIDIPDIISDCMSAISGMNGPIAMIVLGVYLAQVKTAEIFTDKNAWKCSVMRLLVIPAITAVILCLLFPSRREMALALLITACAPVGANLAVYAQKLGMDNRYAVKAICLSTILSVVSMPAVIIFWNLITGIM